MSTAITSAPSIAPSFTPQNSTDNLNPETCISLASILRCYYSDANQPADISHTLLIIPVALELIFSTSLIFTNWRSGKRHFLLVAEGWVIFLLSLIEVLSSRVPAVRTNVSAFQAADQSIGALSFIQLFFYMSFLFSWVRSECLPIIPSRIRRIARPLLLLSIPAVIAMNTVASFVGVSYDPPVPGRSFVEVTFRNDRARFVWPFFSSITLALFTVFQASCFCLAFYRLMRAFWTQRKLEADSKDAAVLFRGIGWINAGIKLGAIETVVGFVFFGGIPVAYVRRVLRMLSRAFLCIGVAKGIDGTEDFGAIQDELGSFSDKSFRRSKLRNLISNPRASTFRPLSPTATAFHATSRAPGINNELLSPPGGETPHPYSASAFLTGEGKNQGPRNSLYARSPFYDTTSPISGTTPGGSLVSPKPTTNNGLPGMSQFAEVKAKRLSQRPRKRVTVYYHQGTPTLHLRLSVLDLPSPAVIAETAQRQPGSEIIEESKGTSMRTLNSHLKRHSRFSAASRGSSIPSVYPASTTHRHADEPENVYRYGSHPYGYFTSSSASPRVGTPPSARNHSTTSSSIHNHSPAASTSHKFDPPTPGYLDSSTRRLSDFSQTSGLSAVNAEIVDKPRRQLSITKQRSTLARAVFYPAPGNNVAMVLTGSENNSPSSIQPTLSGETLEYATPSSTRIPDQFLPAAQRMTPLTAVPHPPLPSPLTNSHPSYPFQRESFPRYSTVDDENGNVITGTAIAPSINEEDYDRDGNPKRSTRAISKYSIGSVPETLQAVRELANKFPSLPPGAVLADIGFRASTMTPVKERDELSSISSISHLLGGSAVAAMGPGKGSPDSTDTEEIIRKRIPAEVKMKGKMFPEVPSEPLPPLPDRVQQLPPPLPARNPKRSESPLTPRSYLPQLASNTTPSQVANAKFTAVPIDPFDDDETTSYRVTASELSPLSMSVKLTHPSTRPQSAMTGLTSPITLSYYQQSHVSNRESSQENAMSPGVIDFGAALKEWNAAGRDIPGMRSMPSLEMIQGHRRSLSTQTRDELERQRQSQSRPGSDVAYNLDLPDKFPNPRRRLQKKGSATSSATSSSLSRIKSIGKVPRRITPQPTRSRHVRGSTHLQPLIIPVSTSGKDVPLSAVGAGGLQTILGVNRAGMSVDIAQEQFETEAGLSSATEGATSSSNGRGVGRFSEALSIEDGGYVPIKLQGSRKGSY